MLSEKKGSRHDVHWKITIADLNFRYSTMDATIQYANDLPSHYHLPQQAV